MAAQHALLPGVFLGALARQEWACIIANMQSAVNTSVLVACPSGTAHKGLVRLRRYEWSVPEDAFVRADGRDDEFFLRRTADGLEAYPRPEFICPKCKKPAVYEHDNFQKELHRAAAADGVIFI